MCRCHCHLALSDFLAKLEVVQMYIKKRITVWAKLFYFLLTSFSQAYFVEGLRTAVNHDTPSHWLYNRMTPLLLWHFLVTACPIHLWLYEKSWSVSLFHLINYFQRGILWTTGSFVIWTKAKGMIRTVLRGLKYSDVCTQHKFM